MPYQPTVIFLFLLRLKRSLTSNEKHIMFKKSLIFGLVGLLAAAGIATATVSHGMTPASLVTAPLTAPASSAPIGLFAFSLSQDAGETLSRVDVLVQKTASSTLASADLGNLTLYRDNGDGSFNPGSDSVSGSAQAQVGSITQVTAGSNNSLSNASSTPTKFFVAIQTGSSWNDAAVADAFTASIVANGIFTSANSPTNPQMTTAVISADTTGPKLISAVAKNTGGTNAKEAGDSIELAFSEATTKPAVTEANLAAWLNVGNGHSLLDTTGKLGSASWNASGTVLTLKLSGTKGSTSTPSTLPTIAVGDPLSIPSTSGIADAHGNKASGLVSLTGTFGGGITKPDDDNDDKDDDGKQGKVSKCTNGLINGRLYTVTGHTGTYKSAGCRLKVFKGKAILHAKGKKFRNIIHLNTFPADGQPTAKVEAEAAKQRLEQAKEEMKRKMEALKQETKQKQQQLKQQLKELKEKNKKK